MKKRVQRQTMMIIWKWQGPDHNLLHVNEQSWKQPGFTGESYLQSVESGEGVFYNECQVAPSETCPDSKLIRATIYNTRVEGETENIGESPNERLLDTLIDYQIRKREEVAGDVVFEHKFMLFLHRGNHYEEQDVDRLFEKFKARKTHIQIFLFANGRDFIYYPVRFRGLLNDKGDFYNQRDDRGDRIQVYDRETNTVLQPYFDRTWWHYEVEFEYKVFELKEDLFDVWLPFLLPQATESVSVADLKEACKSKKDSLLYYRLKSFLNAYEPTRHKTEVDFEERVQLEEEQKWIIKYERWDRRSYLFDDCLVNLKHEEHNPKSTELVKSAYKKTSIMLRKILFDPERTVVTKTELWKLSTVMNELLKVIPGDMD